MISVMKLYELAGVNHNTHYLTPTSNETECSIFSSAHIGLIFGYFVSFFGLQERYGRLLQHEGHHWVLYDDIYKFYSFLAVNDSFTDTVKVIDAVKETEKHGYLQVKEINGKLYYTLCEKAMNIRLYTLKR